MKTRKEQKRRNKRTITEAKGRGAKPTGRVVPSQGETKTSQPVTEAAAKLTSYDIFSLCIERAKNLIKLHKAAHGKKSKPEKYLADAHRAAIVLAVSALDAFVRTFVIAKIRELLAKKSASLPDSLTNQIKKFLKDDGLLESARKDDLLDRVEKAFQNDFENRSFQGTKIITDYMKMVGYDDIFHEVAISAKFNEDTLRTDLDRFTKRRHVIAHRGDYDLNQNPPKEKLVTKKDAEYCIRLVTIIAKNMNKL